MKNSRQVGNQFEEMAASYLQGAGYEILERNYRDRLGEIDIVARDGRYLVFIEVKYRTSSEKGDPAEAVHSRKQRRIRNGARGYLYCHGLGEDVACRFDVVAILGHEIRLIQDAF
ncbi:YraN family protein [Lacrimispora sp.]|uniref:YraN family protein n=1 Tax=Lacrimispora sp. TaxID=2719234 RepID=UPI0039E50461